MIRTSLLFLYILGFSAYAFRNWFVSLCALIILNAVNLHPDMPRTILGIPGLRPWNVLLISVVVAWLVRRGREKARFDPPPLLALFGVGYFFVMFVAWLRMFSDRTGIEVVSTGDLVNDLLINSIKWVVPGLLLFDGARTTERVRFAILTICGIYVLFAVQVLKLIPPWNILDGDALQRMAIKLVEKEIGYSRVNMSMMLAGGSWAILCAREYFQTKSVRWLAFGLFVMVGVGQAMTAGRMGYVTWGLLGFLLGMVRWRRYLVIGPIFVMLVASFVPAVRDRALTGVTDSDMTGEGVEFNTAEMTSDRTLIWPVVIDKIETRPILGFGMAAMKRTGLSDEFQHLNFPHPHNAYLEVLLDSGIVGLLPIVGFYLGVLFISAKLFVFPRSVAERATGGMAFSLTLALLIASFGSQHFLPQEGMVGMFAAIGLAARMASDRSKVRAKVRRPVAVQAAVLPRIAAR